MRRILVWVPALLMLASLVAACLLPSQSAVTYTAYELTCCSKADVVQLWQPGTTVELHWGVDTARRTAVNPTHKVVITAALWGPYSDVTLKQANGAAIQAVQGSAITMDDRAHPSIAEATTFRLPNDLPAGYYQLNLKWDFGDGNSMGASSIVRVGTQ